MFYWICDERIKSLFKINSREFGVITSSDAIVIDSTSFKYITEIKAAEFHNIMNLTQLVALRGSRYASLNANEISIVEFWLILHH